MWMILEDIQACKSYLINPILAKHELTHLQLQVLVEIERTEDMSLNQLADRLAMNTGNASTLCKRLEKDNLLVRERRQDDERFISLHLTDNGKLIIQDLGIRIDDYKNGIEVSDENLRKLRDGMTALQIILKKMQERQREDEDLHE